MAVLADYLDHRGFLWCHVPNESRRSPGQGARLKRLGMKRGVPDALIFGAFWVHTYTNGPQGFLGIAIELKKERGGATSEEQKEWGRRLGEAGWFWSTAHGAKQAMEFLNRCTPMVGFLPAAGDKVDLLR